VYVQTCEVGIPVASLTIGSYNLLWKNIVEKIATFVSFYIDCNRTYFEGDYPPIPGNAVS
jgi:hypothetical protein